MIVASRSPAMQARIVTIASLVDVHAGSALVWHADRLLVVQDDAASAVWIDPVTKRTERLVLEGSGEQLEKSKKPDFEVAFIGPGRTVTILGSGSSPLRRRGAMVDLDTNAVRIVDYGALFGALENALGVVPNLEGATPWKNVLRLFHRGAGTDRSATIDVSLDVLEGHPPRVLGVVPFDLGDVGGVPLHFTDAACFGERIVYLAVAEDTPNAIDDGPILGAAIGLIDAHGATWTPLNEPSGEVSRRKVEGIAIDPKQGTIYAVTDPDDPDKLAELLTICLTEF
jgi:hypothetical protein